MVPVGSVACLKITSTNNSKQKGGIHIDNIGLIYQYDDGFLVHLPSGIHSRLAILLNFVKPCNYCHNRVVPLPFRLAARTFDKC